VKSELRVRDSLGRLAWNQRDDNVRVQDGGDGTVGELLFVEYKNPIEQEGAGGCTPMDYFVRVLSGSKTWSPV